jgi:hypothetical protein
MTIKHVQDAPDRILAALQPQGVLVEHLPADEIEAYPIAELKARLSALGLLQSCDISPALKRAVAEAAPDAADQVLLFLDGECTAIDSDAVAASPLPVVLSELRRRGINHKAAVRRAQEAVEEHYEKESLDRVSITPQNRDFPVEPPANGRLKFAVSAAAILLACLGGVFYVYFPSYNVARAEARESARLNVRIDKIEEQVAKLAEKDEIRGNRLENMENRLEDVDEKLAKVTARAEERSKALPFIAASYPTIETARAFFATVNSTERSGSPSAPVTKRLVGKAVLVDQQTLNLPSEIIGQNSAGQGRDDVLITGSISPLQFSENSAPSRMAGTTGMVR